MPSPNQEIAATAEAEVGLRLLVDAVTDFAIIMLDRDGRITSWNAGAERITGWTADEIVGRPFSVFYPEDGIAAGRPERELALAREVGRYEEQGLRLRKDGSAFMAHVTLTPLRDATGELKGFAKVTRDITERVAADEALRASEAYLRSIL